MPKVTDLLVPIERAGVGIAGGVGIGALAASPEKLGLVEEAEAPEGKKLASLSEELASVGFCASAGTAKPASINPARRD